MDHMKWLKKKARKNKLFARSAFCINYPAQSDEEDSEDDLESV